MDLNVISPDEFKEELPKPTNEDKNVIDAIRTKPIESQIDSPIESPKAKEEEEEELEVKPVIDDEVIFGTKEDPPSPKVKKKGTEKQREHLKKAREKALATRQAKAKIRKEEEEKKSLERQQKREEREKLKIEKEDRDHLKQVEVKPHSYMNQLSNEQLVELQQKAIENYESKRKAKKVIKRKEQMKIAQEKKIYDTINKAVNPDPDDVWGSCFN